MPFVKGKSGNPKGRKKGQTNKLTATVKEALEEAFHHAGGANYLKQIAADDPKTFCTLLAKIIPTQVTADVRMTLEDLITKSLDERG